LSLAIFSGPSGGNFAGGSTTTATVSGGIATFNPLQLNTAGTYTLRASDASPILTSSPSNSFVVSPNTAFQLAFGQPPTNTTAGVAISPAVTVQIQDQFGNLVTGDSSDQVTLAVFSGPGGFTGTSTTMATASAGVASFGNLHLNTTGTYTLSENAPGGLTGSNSSSFNITPASATHLAFGVQPTGTSAGATLSPAVTVQLLDTFNNLVTTDNTDQVTLGIASGPGSFSGGSTTSVTASGGVATFSNLHLNTAGNYTLSETATGSISGPASNSFAITPGTANKLGFGVQPTNTTAAVAISPAVTVQVQDSFGNLITSDNTDQVTVAIASGPGPFTGSSTTAMANGGVATFNNLVINIAGSYTLGASATNLINAPVSSSFNIIATSANHLHIAQQPTTAAAGAVISPPVTVQVLDQFNNVVTTNSSSVTIAIANNAGGGTLSGMTNVSVSSGVATFSNLSINAVGSGYTLKATDGSLTFDTSSPFNITAATANHLVFLQQPTTPTTAGVTISPSITVEVEDSSNNVATGDTSSVTIAIGTNAGGGTLSGTKTIQVSGGIATFSTLSIDKAGSGYTLVATDGSLTQATSNPFTISPSSATQLAFGQQPTGTSAGATLSPAVTVQIEDQFGNVVTGNASSVNIAIVSGPTGAAFVNGSTTSVAASGGVATFSNLMLNPPGTNYQLQASDGSLSLTDSNVFTITPGSASKLVFTAQPSSAMAGATLGTVKVELEDSLGNLASNDPTTTVNLSLVGGPSGATLTGGSAQAANGVAVATFTNLSVDKAGTYTLMATDGSLTSAPNNSTSFTITVGAASHLQFALQPDSSTVAGKTIKGAIQVQVVDAFGNLETTDSSSKVTLQIDPNANPGPDKLYIVGATSQPGFITKTVTKGVVTFGSLTTQVSNLYIKKAGIGYMIEATDSNFSGSFDSNAFNITAAAAANIYVKSGSGQQPSPTVGTAFSNPLIALVTDKFGNPVSGAGVTFHLPTNAAYAQFTTSPQISTDSSGQASVDVMAGTLAGSYTIKATVSGVTTPAQFQETNMADQAVKLLLFAPGEVNQGAFFHLTVKAVDQYNNVVMNYLGMVQFSSNDPNATLPQGSVSIVSGQGTFDCVLRQLGQGVTITASDVSGNPTTLTPGTVTIDVVAPSVVIPPGTKPGRQS